MSIANNTVRKIHINPKQSRWSTNGVLKYAMTLNCLAFLTNKMLSIQKPYDILDLWSDQRDLAYILYRHRTDWYISVGSPRLVGR